MKLNCRNGGGDTNGCLEKCEKLEYERNEIFKTVGRRAFKTVNSRKQNVIYGCHLRKHVYNSENPIIYGSLFHKIVNN